MRKEEKHNRLNVGRIALERLVGALINCNLLQSGGGVRGSLTGTKKNAQVSAHFSFDF